MVRTISKMASDTRVRYLSMGFLIFSFNLIAAKLFFSIPGALDTIWTRNGANLAATEASVIFAFFLHSKVTWSSRQQFPFLLRLLRFHAITGIGLFFRIATFAVIDVTLGHWLIATLGSIIIAVVFNYFGYDRLVFRNNAVPSTP